jgi:hypothetical protein
MTTLQLQELLSIAMAESASLDARPSAVRLRLGKVKEAFDCLERDGVPLLQAALQAGVAERQETEALRQEIEALRQEIEALLHESEIFALQKAEVDRQYSAWKKALAAKIKLAGPTPTLSEIRAARQELVEMGFLVDSGRRKWCEETGRYEILWVLADDETLQLAMMGRAST